MIAIDMPMPESCNKCRFCDPDDDCSANEPPTIYRHAPSDGKPDWCPLIDLSQHEGGCFKANKDEK